MHLLLRLSVLTAAVTPAIALAQSGINQGVISQYASGIIQVINGIFVPVLLALAFIVFLWGVFNYFILGAAEDDKRKDGRKFVMWGVIGFVVIFSVWGLVSIVSDVIGLGAGTNPTPPTFNTAGGGGGGGGSQTCPTGQLWSFNDNRCEVIP